MNDYHNSLIPVDVQEVAIETNSFCNQGCVYCPATHYRREDGAMSFSLFRRIADQIAGCAPYRVFLYGYNEPSLDDTLPAKISYLKQKGLRVLISSNGSGLSPSRVKALKDAGLTEISVNLPSVDTQTYRKMRTRDNLKEVLANLDDLKDNNIFTEIIVLGKLDKNHQAAATGIMRAFPSQRIVLSPIINRAGLVPQEYANNMMHKRLAGCLEKRPGRSIYITYEGKVLLCCQDYKERCVAGDLKKEDLDDILRQERYAELRAKSMGLVESEPDFICKKCIIALPFGRSKKEYLSDIFCKPCDIDKAFCRNCIVGRNINIKYHRIIRNAISNKLPRRLKLITRRMGHLFHGCKL
jgi:MoaA/NifB/PqqE/SkfB family radical SAM enzyme